MFCALLFVFFHYVTLYSIFFYSFYLTMTDTKSTAAADVDAKKVEDAPVEKEEEAKTTDDSTKTDKPTKEEDASKTDEPTKEEDVSKTDELAKKDASKEDAKPDTSADDGPKSPEQTAGEKKRESPLSVTEAGAPDAKKAAVSKDDSGDDKETEESKADSDVAATPEGASSDMTECPTDEKKADSDQAESSQTADEAPAVVEVKA